MLAEKITKQRAKQFYDEQVIQQVAVGTFAGLADIHRYLFADIYDFAGTIRDVNIAKGQFSFAPMMYLKPALDYIDKLPHQTYEEVITKYVEMNVAHPFREGNGRSMRIWLDLMLRESLGQVIDWARVDKEDYLLAMARSPIKDVELRVLLQDALTNEVNNRDLYMKGIDQSYYYEGYTTYLIDDL